MHDFDPRTEMRLDRFVRETLAQGLARDAEPVSVEAWEAPGEPVPFAEAVTGSYRPFALGSRWGRPWGTTWFHVDGTVPDRWAAVPGCHVELVTDLGFDPHAGPGFQAEALAWRPDGTTIKAVEPRNAYVPVDVPAGRRFEVYLEAASNPSVAGDWFTPSPMGDVETAPRVELYEFRRCELQLIDDQVYELAQDVRVLGELMRVLPADQPRRHELLAALETMLDVVDPDDLAGTASAARAALADALASPAAASAHRIHAVGHAHIDSAWLWPTRETVRKCARTFSNVLELIGHDDAFRFACSSAQQYEWIKDSYPELFERIKQQVAAGRFVPAGGMWVESDTNMPGGEALARQFVVGTRFFLDEFGFEGDDVWLPDTFGYSAAMPQIARAAGKTSFLTQKISWNDTNTFPHHTFLWQGIDGTSIFTHFPPADTYNGTMDAEELARAERNFKEKGKANTSLLPFGFGDGGGGPTREMISAARRQADLEGSPKVVLSSPSEFFAAAKAEYPAPPTWFGELYLEYHRGTYTSQHRTKEGNRRSEHLLREAELWAATAAVRTGAAYPYDELTRLWKIVLLQQFHDILPGSAIAWVYREAERNYAEIAERLQSMIGASLADLTGPGDATLVANAAPASDHGVPGLSVAPAQPDLGEVTLTQDGTEWVLDNGLVRARIDADGTIVSLVDLVAGREVVPQGERLGVLHLHRDRPNQWEAWDINSFYLHNDTPLTSADSIAPHPAGPDGRRGVDVTRHTAKSGIVQSFSLAPGQRAVRIDVDLDWHERRRLLKMSVPLDVQARESVSEIQFGHIRRPIHENTSWDAARFEVCAHRWVHVGEPNYGVGLANSATYGYSFTADPKPDGGTYTTIHPSLVRAPMFPDPESDQGHHRLSFDVLPGATIHDTVEQGYRANLGVRTVTGSHPVEPLVAVDNPGIVVEAVKLAEDRSGDVVVRLYESEGNHATGHLTVNFPHTGVERTDLLERPLDGRASEELALRPFEIATLRIAR